MTSSSEPTATAVALPGHRGVWRLAGPIILSNLTVPLLGAVDTAVVGHLPEAYYLGAVAVGATIFNFLYWGFGFLRMATTGFTAQAYGATDADEVRAHLGRALLLAGGLGFGLIICQIPIAAVAFRLLEGSPEVERLAETYLFVRIWGAPAAMANYALLGWFIGIHNTSAALVQQVVMNGINILLDLLFVLGFGWDVAGVAAATAIAEYAGVAVGFWLVGRNLGRIGGQLARGALLQPERLKRMFVVNFDIFIRTLCLITGFSIFTAVGAKSGDLVLAANAVLLTFIHFMAYGLDGFAFAAEALVGGAVGGRNRRALRQAVRVTTLWALVTALGFMAFFALAGAVLINTLTGVPEVRDAARTFLPWAVAAPLASVWAYQLDGIFIGATRNRDMRNAAVASLAIYLAVLAALQPAFGNHGLWLALLIFNLARGVTLALRYPALERSVAPAPAIANGARRADG